VSGRYHCYKCIKYNILKWQFAPAQSQAPSPGYLGRFLRNIVTCALIFVTMPLSGMIMCLGRDYILDSLGNMNE
jgi:hypothetical protein